MVAFKLTWKKIREKICVDMLLIGINENWKAILQTEIKKDYFHKVSRVMSS